MRCIGNKPQEVFASSQQECLEMADLAQEAAADIAKSHDWRGLTKIHTINTPGETAPLPPDFDRMVLGSAIDDPATWFWGYHPFETVNDWMRAKNGSFQVITPGGWIILGKEIHFYPAPSGSATFPYISSAWARSESGTPKTAFSADNDTFVLSERLLTLAIVWRFKEAKGLEYAEDQASYDIALAQEQTRDKGARVLRSPRTYLSGRIAYTGRAFP